MLRKILGIIAGLFVLFVAATVLVLWMAMSGDKKADQDAKLLHAGMSTDELVAAFPTRFSFATIVEQLRNVPCKQASGELADPETYVSWPDTDPGDKEGEA